MKRNSYFFLLYSSVFCLCFFFFLSIRLTDRDEDGGISARVGISKLQAGLVRDEARKRYVRATATTVEAEGVETKKKVKCSYALPNLYQMVVLGDSPSEVKSTLEKFLKYVLIYTNE